MKKDWIGLVCFVSFFIIGTLPTFAQQLIEGPVVRLIYFVPRDLQPQPNITADMDSLIKQIQRHYASEMGRLGYDRKTFKIETDVNGNAVVHRMVGKFDAADYPKSGDALFDQLSEEIGQRYDLSKDIYLVAANTLEDFVARGDFEGWSGAGGIALIPSRLFDVFDAGLAFHTAAHQLGHAFGLTNNFRYNGNLMYQGGGLDLTAPSLIVLPPGLTNNFRYNGNLMYQGGSLDLSVCDAEWLDVHRAFNRSRPAANTSPTFEMLPPSLAAPPYEMRLRFKAIDPDGLHQVQLLTVTLAGPAAGSWELLKCKRVDGDSVVVEFVTTGLAPASKVFLSAIDVNGNFGISEALPLDITQLLPPASEVSIPDVNLAAVIRSEIGNSLTTHTLLNLTHLDAANREIKELTGLEHAHNLKHLHLGSNGISDVSPLASLTQLKYLGLGRNGISDVSPLASLTQLSGLFLEANDISDVSSLANLTQLKTLDLGANDISDVSPLANLTQLTKLDLGSNSILDVSSLASLTQLNILYLSGNGISDVSPLANLTQLTKLRLDSLVALRQGNGISDVSPLANLTQLKSLGLFGNAISDVSPLANLIHLDSLDLTGGAISDVSPLASLTQLDSLYLGRNDISDVSPLASLTQLDSLYLGRNDISDVSPLASLTQLEYLDLESNNISDVSPLASLTQLEYLDLESNNISDISPLLGLDLSGRGWADTGLDVRDNPLNWVSVQTHIPALQARGIEVKFDLVTTASDVFIPDVRLVSAIRKEIGDSITKHTLLKLTSLKADDSVANQWIRNLKGLEHAHNLKSLDLTGGAISDVSPLTNLTQLKSLSLENNDISDISSLASLTQLIRLEIGSNDISDVSPLASLTQLGILDLNDNRISDVSPLASLTQLIRLELGGNDISDVSPLANLTHLIRLRLENNDISDISPLLGLDLSRMGGSSTALNVRGNPLNHASLQTHIPALQARGIGVEFGIPGQASTVELLANYPNPFNSETWIPYRLAEPAEVTLRIYTLEEELIRTLALGHQPAGLYQNEIRAAYWDGRNELGEPVPSGRYFYTLTVGHFTTARKILVRE